jgi:hypothetical protein
VLADPDDVEVILRATENMTVNFDDALVGWVSVSIVVVADIPGHVEALRIHHDAADCGSDQAVDLEEGHCDLEVDPDRPWPAGVNERMPFEAGRC